MKKKWMITIGAAVLLLALVVGMVGCSSEGTLEITGNLNGQQEGIWVNGEGKVSAVPDIATLSVGVQAQATSVADARSQAADAMDKVMQALKDNDVAEKDIQTQYFNIQKVTRWDSIKQEEIDIGYQVTNTVTAKIRDLTKTGTIIDSVATAGGDLTRINNIGFTVDDSSQYRKEAREKAMADAAAKAKQLASAADVKLGKISYITESSYVPSPIYRDVAIKAEGATSVETPVSPGEMEITVNVQIAYNID